MPTYSYRCADCGYAFDIHQSFTDDALRECPRCGGTLRKQYGTVGVTFNGSGFYRTDSRQGSAGSSSPGEGAAPSSGSGSAVGSGASSSGSSGSSTSSAPSSPASTGS